jgi:hypothetical protein
MNRKNNEHINGSVDESLSQKGALFSVMMVGAFIALMWAGIFWLYMIRT